MARKRISEYRAKTLLCRELGLPYTGIQIKTQNNVILRESEAPYYTVQGEESKILHSVQDDINKKLQQSKKYIIKVDQGIKGRFKKGLVLLDQTPDQIPGAVKQLSEKGYSQFLIEEQQEYNQSEEKYISIERTRTGYKVLHSSAGGVNIEKQKDLIEEAVIPYQYTNNGTIEQSNNGQYSPRYVSLSRTINLNLLEKLLKIFDKYYYSFLEINPFIHIHEKLSLLDAAVEVDSTASFFVHNAWTENDYTEAGKKQQTAEEINIRKLAAKSQAAFSLEVLNPDGSIFMMLSGGGASIVLADEVHNRGLGKELANYGEYSGNPNAEETYIYAKNLISLLLKSAAEKKVLVIAGGVANFTDVRITFKGLIKALEEATHQLQEKQIKVFVRRGGPYQEEGLRMMNSFLEKNNLLGIVAGPEMILTEIVTHALDYLKK